jgi:Predicted nucleotide-binding protein containing TIR-like domain
VRPKIFIGSSREALNIATAINTNLQREAECKVWSDGVFGLSLTAVRSLTDRVKRSDFGIFIFSPDDLALIRGNLFSIPRDNLLYELGLFSGALGPERCFFAIPLDSKIHLPSDLLGMTPGDYESKRDDEDWEAAVRPFCERVRKRIVELGFAKSSDHDRLRDMAVSFECCDWITDEPRRVERKRTIFADMVDFCRTHPVNKGTLLEEHRPGFDIALAAAIHAIPEAEDDQLIRAVRSASVGRGFAQHVFVQAMIHLAEAGRLTPDRREALVRWMQDFHASDTHLAPLIENFRSMPLSKPVAAHSPIVLG